MTAKELIDEAIRELAPQTLENIELFKRNVELFKALKPEITGDDRPDS